MNRRISSSLVGTVAAALALFSSTARSAQDAEPFTSLFARTCMKFIFQKDELSRTMSAQSEPLPPAKSEFFLGGKRGQAWSIKVDGLEYAVSLREDGVCAVFAFVADVPRVREDFRLLVQRAPSDALSSSELNPALGPNQESIASISYAWHRSQNEPALLFTLTVASPGEFPVQAMASLAIGRLPR